VKFEVGKTYQIKFGTDVRDAKVVRVSGAKVTVSIDLGSRHPLLSSYSHESLAQKVKDSS